MARDERETGDRALLNLGHTFGHALEGLAGFSDRLLHGEGVSIGMALAADFSASLGMMPQADADRLTAPSARCRAAGDDAGDRRLRAGRHRYRAHDDDDGAGQEGEARKMTFILMRGSVSAVIAPDVDPVKVSEFLDRKLAQK